MSHKNYIEKLDTEETEDTEHFGNKGKMQVNKK